ncbi:MAG: prolipoprotein diacylglyceryl transferase family protein [bacterium]
MVHLEYALPVAFGLLLMLFFPSTRHFEDPEDRRRYRTLQIVTLVAAIIGAKLAALSGDHFWPVVPLQNWSQLVVSGRSILGGLLFGHLAAEAAKPIVGYRLPPNDRFAALLPFSIAIGRVGCLLAGCCRGLPHQGLLSITYSDGIPRHPEPAYEIAFQLAVGFFFLFLVRRKLFVGRVFSLYLVLYGLFRFFTEFIRETPKIYGSYSFYQMLCVAMVAIGAGELIWRTHRYRKERSFKLSPPAPALANDFS